MSGLDVAALRAATEAATPGPWHVNPGAKVVEVVSAEDDLIYRRVRDAQAPRDAAFIAAANPSAVLALLDRVEAAEAAVTQQERDIRAVQEYADAETARANTAEAAVGWVRALAVKWGAMADTLDHPSEDPTTRARGVSMAYCALGLTAALDQPAPTTPGGDA